jgi:DnaJ-class molecular chaperone
MASHVTKKTCPQCKGRGKLNESMGSRECCGVCRGTGLVTIQDETNLVESVAAEVYLPNRLTD